MSIDVPLAAQAASLPPQPVQGSDNRQRHTGEDVGLDNEHAKLVSPYATFRGR
jgi:hypothetical protein